MIRTKKILMVDDEEGFVALLRPVLEERGFEVSAAMNAVDAGIEMSGSLPALILMDIKMPGINGLQACEAIKKNTKLDMCGLASGVYLIRVKTAGMLHIVKVEKK